MSSIVLKENLVVQVIAGLIALYDISTLSIQAVLITSIFAISLFYITSSYYVLVCVLLTPQVIRILNFLMGKNETFANATPELIQKNLESIQAKQKEMYKKESFTTAIEVADRVKSLKNDSVLNKVSNPDSLNLDSVLEGDVYKPSTDKQVPDGDTYIPSFMRQYESLGVPLNVNGRIPTQVEESVPHVGVVDRNPQENPFLKGIDTESIEVTMKRTLADKPTSSNIASVDF